MNRVGKSTPFSDFEEEAASTPEASSFGCLPEEILQKILFFCGPREIASTSLVSRTWYNLSMDPALWRQFYASLPGVRPIKEGNFPVLYRQFSAVPDNFRHNRYEVQTPCYPTDAVYVQASNDLLCFMRPEGCVELYDPDTQLLVTNLTIPLDEVICAFATSDKYFALGCLTKQVTVYDRNTKKALTSFTCENIPERLQFFGDSLCLFSKEAGRADLFLIKTSSYLMLCDGLSAWSRIDEEHLLLIATNGLCLLMHVPTGDVDVCIQFHQPFQDVLFDVHGKDKIAFVVNDCNGDLRLLIFGLDENLRLSANQTMQNIPLVPYHSIFYANGHFWLFDAENALNKIDSDTGALVKLSPPLNSEKKTLVFWNRATLFFYTVGEGMRLFNFAVLKQAIVSDFLSQNLESQPNHEQGRLTDRSLKRRRLE